MKIFTLTKLGRTLLMLSAMAVTVLVGTGAVFAQEPTLDKLSFDKQVSGQSMWYGVRSASNVISGVIVIPDTYKDLPVTYVIDWGFRDCSNITSVVIPAKVRLVKDAAFSGCTNLKSITFGGSNTSATWGVGSYASFPGADDLKVKYGEGGAGTYIREGNKWTKQGGYAPPPPPPQIPAQGPPQGGRRHLTLNGIWTRNDGTQITISDNGQIFTVTDGNGRFTRTFTER